MDTTRKNGRFSTWVILLVAAFLSAMSSGAVAQKQTKEEKALARAIAKVEDPSKSLWITVESVPSEAIVYGVRDGKAGTRLGTTPITFKYVREGQWVYSSIGDPYETLVHDVSATIPFLRRGRESLAFNVLLVKDGHKPYNMYQIIEDRKSWEFFSGLRIESLDGGVQRTFTALLEPVTPLIQPPAPSIQPPAIPPTQQQQQQQQQTVVVPDSKDKKTETGTVVLSCNVDGAEVHVDGLFVGNAPVTLKLKEGIHIISVEKSGYSTYRRELRVFADSDVSLRVELTKK
jgi:hypothetical protein